MFQLAYQIIDSKYRIRTRSRSFKSQAAMLAFMRKLEQSDNFFRILAFSGPNV